MMTREWWWDDDVLLDQFSGKPSGPLTDDNVVVTTLALLWHRLQLRPQGGGVGG